jgi:[CysO sulfur-carrier protein]-S-L-cysteine hydrolase
MDGVSLTEEQAREMIEHSEAGRPNEACGILAALDGSIVRVFPMVNAAGSPVRYSLEPKEQFSVYRAIDENGWELGGIFHSHTHTEAYPSPTDVRLASEEVPYLIVSLAEPDPVIRAFRIVKEDWSYDTGEIVEVPVTITG